MDEQDNTNWLEARRQSIAWAKRLLERTDWVIIDTETTGFRRTDQVVQVAILAPDGTTVLDTLVKATVPSCPEAFNVHGISEDQLMDAPGFADVFPQIVEATWGKYMVIYNGDFDLRLLRQSAEAAGLTSRDFPHAHYDAMIMYARFVGEWSDYRNDFKWQKLPGGDHTAMGDCRAVLSLIHHMADTAA